MYVATFTINNLTLFRYMKMFEIICNQVLLYQKLFLSLKPSWI